MLLKKFLLALPFILALIAISVYQESIRSELRSVEAIEDELDSTLATVENEDSRIEVIKFNRSRLLDIEGKDLRPRKDSSDDLETLRYDINKLQNTLKKRLNIIQWIAFGIFLLALGSTMFSDKIFRKRV